METQKQLLFGFLQVLIRPRGSVRPQEGAIVKGLRDPNAHLLIVVVVVVTQSRKHRSKGRTGWYYSIHG